MKIIGGRYRGHGLVTPRGMQTRPTSGRVREALFDILRDDVAGASFLDIYAGSGAVGIEAASRGAGHVVFVDTRGPALRALKRNLSALSMEATVLALDATRVPRRLMAMGLSFDIIFLDPPYDSMGGAWITARRLVTDGRLAPGGILVLEHGVRDFRREEVPGLDLFDQRRYGDTGLLFYRRLVI